jgi:hypothetical protein
MLDNTEGILKMDNPEKLVTLRTQEEDKQNKNTTLYVLDITICVGHHYMQAKNYNKIQ